MKKIILLLVLFLLSGCSSSLLENYILEKSGILEDSEYIRYLELQKIGKINEEGFMVVDEDASADNATGLTVSLVSNNHFEIIYYKNLEYDSVISDNTVILDFGESIYAMDPEIKNILESSYKFVEFEIYKVKDGQRTLIDKKSELNEPLYTMTESSHDYSISIVPIGEFIPCNLIFTATLQNDDGPELAQLSWKVDNEEVLGDKYQFIPNSNFTVECNYASLMENYYLLESNIIPTKVNEDGNIRFENMSAESSKDGFNLVFKPYTSIEFVNTKELFKNVEVTAKTLTSDFTLKSGSENMGKYAAGDTITFTIRNDYRLTSNGLPSPTIKKSGSNDIYTFIVGESSPSSVTISVEKQTTDTVNTKYISNGTIILTDENGNPLNIGEEIEKNENIIVSIKPKNGYYITGRNVSNNVYKETMKYSDYTKNLSSIIDKHEIKKYINVFIETEDQYGECVFYRGKDAISGQINFKEGDTIRLEYILTDESYQYSNWTLLTKVRKDIKITEEMNDSTIKASDYISLKKRGEKNE